MQQESCSLRLTVLNWTKIIHATGRQMRKVAASVAAAAAAQVRQVSDHELH